MRMISCALVAAVSVSVALVASDRTAHADPPTAQYLGQKLVPSTAKLNGTVIRGLSAISYDPAHQLYYVISDDQSQYNAARFYTVRIPLSSRGIDAVDFVTTRPWLDPAGRPFGAQNLDVGPPVLPPDPEGIAFDGSRQRLYWSSEGEWEPGRDGKPAFVLNPWVRIAGLDGSYQGEFTMPPGFSMSPADNTGPKPNQSLEGLTVSPTGQFLFLALEDPRYEDGPNPDHDHGALTRITKFDIDTKLPVAQYAYRIDPSGAPDTSGVSDMFALSDTTFLVIERGGPPSTVRLYRAEIGLATDVLQLPSLMGAPVTPMTKTLVADLTTTPGLQPLDNIEGVTLGPNLPDGRQSIVLVSDDNFSKSQVTQFITFAM
jgi:hypothetical protein